MTRRETPSGLRPPALPTTLASPLPDRRSNPGRDRAATRQSPDLDGVGTVRPGAKALARSRNGDVLLLEERRPDGSTFWTLPGGGLEAGESFADCLRREVQEELDCEVLVGTPIAVCSYLHTSRPATRSRYAVFRSTIDDPTPVGAEGVVDLVWVPPSSPPEGTLEPFRRLLDELSRSP